MKNYQNAHNLGVSDWVIVYDSCDQSLLTHRNKITYNFEIRIQPTYFFQKNNPPFKKMFPDESDTKVFDDEDLEKYEDEARQWSDQCVYECRICNSVSYMNYGSLFDHIR